MAVLERKHKRWSTFYAVNTWKGKQVREKVGRNRRAAESRDGAMQREIGAGTYVPPASRARDTVGGFGAFYLEPRENPYATDERRMFRLYVRSRPWLLGMHLDDWTPAVTDRLLRELRAERKPDGSRRLRDKTISNLFGLLSTMFDAAVRLERCLRNPIVLAPNELQRQAKEEKEIYEVEELSVLMHAKVIPWPLRMLNTLLGYTGQREGEGCGRRWRDLDDSCRPLAALSVHDQYNGRPLKKKDQPRMVPVHPDLLAALKAWAEEGFELYVGRPPTPDDFIVPNVSKLGKQPCWTRSQFYKAFVKYAEAAGVRPRSVHSLRHSFITHAQRGGADKAVLEKVTHNKAGEMIDRYTHTVWGPVCAAVSCFSLTVRPEVHPSPRRRGDPGGSGPSFLMRKSARIPEDPEPEQGSIPGASTVSKQKSSLARGSRKAPRTSLQEQIRESNRTRKRALLSLEEADPLAAAPGLAVCRALDGALEGDQDKVDRELAAGAAALWGDRGSLAKRGGRRG